MVNQTGPVGCVPDCPFIETDHASFSNFKGADFTTLVINSGLNQTPGYTLTGDYTANGFAVPEGTGIRATFTTFILTLTAHPSGGGNILVAQSTGLVSGEADVFGPEAANRPYARRVRFPAEPCTWFGCTSTLFRQFGECLVTPPAASVISLYI
jgi:hypothetical protein